MKMNISTRWRAATQAGAPSFVLSGGGKGDDSGDYILDTASSTYCGQMLATGGGEDEECTVKDAVPAAEAAWTPP